MLNQHWGNKLKWLFVVELQLSLVSIQQSWEAAGAHQKQEQPPTHRCWWADLWWPEDQNIFIGSVLSHRCSAPDWSEQPAALNKVIDVSTHSYASQFWCKAGTTHNFYCSSLWDDLRNRQFTQHLSTLALYPAFRLHYFRVLLWCTSSSVSLLSHDHSSIELTNLLSSVVPAEWQPLDQWNKGHRRSVWASEQSPQLWCSTVRAGWTWTSHKGQNAGEPSQRRYFHISVKSGLQEFCHSVRLIAACPRFCNAF